VGGAGICLSDVHVIHEFVVVGVAGGTVPWQFWATKYEVELTNTVWGSLGDLRDVIALAADGHLKPKVKTFGFDEIPHAFEAPRERSARRPRGDPSQRLTPDQAGGGTFEERSRKS
jgi:propanol-preferring alcohol dehydrogenase